MSLSNSFLRGMITASLLALYLMLAVGNSWSYEGAGRTRVHVDGIPPHSGEAAPEPQAMATGGVMYYLGNRFVAPMDLSFSQGVLVVNGWTAQAASKTALPGTPSSRSRNRGNLDREVLLVVRDRLARGLGRVRALQDARNLYAASPLVCSAKGDSTAIVVIYADTPGQKYVKLFPLGMPLHDPTAEEIALKAARANGDRLRALKSHLDRGGLVLYTGSRVQYIPPLESSAVDRALTKLLSGGPITADEDAAISAAVPLELRALELTKRPLVPAAGAK